MYEGVQKYFQVVSDSKPREEILQGAVTGHSIRLRGHKLWTTDYGFYITKWPKSPLKEGKILMVNV